MTAVAIIPSRLASTRLPNKALVDICGLPMIAHVIIRTQMAQTLEKVFVATDSVEISSVAKKFGAEVIMTKSSHQTGTDRIAEAAQSIDTQWVVNVQGDEALVNPQYIDKIVTVMREQPAYPVGILVNSFRKRNSTGDIKVVVNNRDEVMYLSRTDIPSDARTANPEMLKAYHIVPFRKDFLIEYTKLERGRLENIEYNEYLRVLEHGYKIKAVRVESSAVSVDTEEDLSFVREQMLNDSFFYHYGPDWQ